MKYDKIYEFSIFDNTEKDENGVGKKRNFFIRKPNRVLHEDAELFHGRVINEAITKHKLIPKAVLVKTFTEHEGVFTDKQKEEYKDLLRKLRDLESDYQSIVLKDSDARSEKEKDRLNEISEEILSVRNAIHNFELQEDDLYRHTAETYARKKLIFWWVVNTAYEQVDENKQVLILDGKTYEDKLDQYEKLIEENEELWSDAFAKFTYNIAIFMSPNVDGNVKVFKEILEILKQQEIDDNEVVEDQIEEPQDDELEDNESEDGKA